VNHKQGKQGEKKTESARRGKLIIEDLGESTTNMKSRYSNPELAARVVVSGESA